MRQRIDISEVESETKIRAKYLRALENEEWDLLPGPTYVKSFLRTYAEALGLDGKLLIEEYKLRHERLSDVELQPIRPPTARDTRRRRRGAGSGRGWAVVAVVAAILAALYLLGQFDGGGEEEPRTAATATTTTERERSQARERTPTTGTGTTEQAERSQERPQRPRLARLQIVPSGPVYVCLRRAGGETVVNGVILQAGSTQPTYRSRRFLLLLGNSEARLRINGRLRNVAPAASGIAYEITPRRVRTLPDSRRPTCSA